MDIIPFLQVIIGASAPVVATTHSNLCPHPPPPSLPLHALPAHSDQNMDEASDKTCSNCQVNFSYALGCVSQLHSKFCHIISKMILSLNEIK